MAAERASNRMRGTRKLASVAHTPGACWALTQEAQRRECARKITGCGLRRGDLIEQRTVHAAMLSSMEALSPLSPRKKKDAPEATKEKERDREARDHLHASAKSFKEEAATVGRKGGERESLKSEPPTADVEADTAEIQYACSAPHRDGASLTTL